MCQINQNLYSFFVSSLEILLLCLINIKIKRKKERIFTSRGKEKIKDDIKKTKAEIIDAKETYLDIKKIIIQVKIDKIRTSQRLGKTKLNPLTAPKLVATPLPPLNFK